MRVVLKSYKPNEPIPVASRLNNKKLSKYFNRETAAGIMCFKEIAESCKISSETPFYYATCVVDFEDYGLDKIVDSCKGDDGMFSQERFVEKGMSSISPLTQFKILYNMPLSFISIENNLTGDNAVIYDSARGLIQTAKYSDCDSFIAIGAGKVWKDGTVEAGVALLTKEEIDALPSYDDSVPAIMIFRDLAANGGVNE